MSGSGDEDLGNSHDERWVHDLEKAAIRERLWRWIADLVLLSLIKFRKRRGLRAGEGSYPQLASLELAGHSADLVSAVQRRAFRETVVDNYVLLVLVGTFLLVGVITNILSFLGDVGLVFRYFFALPYAVFVFSLTMWEAGRFSEVDPRLFSLIVDVVGALNYLRMLKVSQFAPSCSGTRKIIKARKNLRRSLRKQSREVVLLAANLTGTRMSDQGYFKCARPGLWLLHASENLDDVEALENALYACGCLLDHLLHKKPWEVAELPPAPGDVADLSTGWIGRVAQNVGLRIQLGPVTALIGLAAAVFGFAAKVV